MKNRSASGDAHRTIRFSIDGGRLYVVKGCRVFQSQGLCGILTNQHGSEQRSRDQKGFACWCLHGTVVDVALSDAVMDVAEGAVGDVAPHDLVVL